MKRPNALLLAALLVFSPFSFAAAQEKPVAALGRIAVLGEISEVQKKIIYTRAESILSRAYDLISREQYARAEEAAFKSLDLSQCTEEQCIRKIQELLQVERLFVLQILREQELTQLTLTLIRADSKRVVEQVCRKCDLAELYDEIEELVAALIQEAGGLTGRRPSPNKCRREVPYPPYCFGAESGWGFSPFPNSWTLVTSMTRPKIPPRVTLQKAPNWRKTATRLRPLPSLQAFSPQGF